MVSGRRRLKGIKRLEASMFPGSVELPCRRQPDVAVPAVVPVVVDVETVGVEVADVDPVAVRVDMLPAPIRGTRP